MTERTWTDDTRRGRLVVRSAPKSIFLAIISPMLGWGWGLGSFALNPFLWIGADTAALCLWALGLLVVSAVPPLAVVLAHVSLAVTGWRRPSSATLLALLLSYAATAFMLLSWAILYGWSAALGID